MHSCFFEVVKDLPTLVREPIVVPTGLQGDELDVLDPTGAGVADTIYAAFSGYGSFLPDDPSAYFIDYESNGGASRIAGSPTAIETGTVQSAFEFEWSDGSYDTIMFQSNGTVPEPSSAILLLLAVMVLFFTCREGGHFRKARDSSKMNSLESKRR
jgi:hypothetical protein